MTIQCSGIRRIEQIAEYAGEGDEMINAPWAEGSIDTAHWTGVSLKKVLMHCGGLIDGAKHLEFYGAETYFKHVRACGITYRTYVNNVVVVFVDFLY